MSLWAMLMECKKSMASPILFMMSEASEEQGNGVKEHGCNGLVQKYAYGTINSAAPFQKDFQNVFLTVFTVSIFH